MARKKILYVATVDIHIKAFHLPYLKMMHDKGWEVHVATGEKGEIPFCDKKHTICVKRNPFRLNNIRSIKQLQSIINNEQFDIIHCHTPMGSVVARIASKKAQKKGTRIIYTAHGFHFYKGAPLFNWLIFYPVEKYLAKFTDTLITINQEDYERAKKKFSKRCMDIRYVPGVGIDVGRMEIKMNESEKETFRDKLGVSVSDKILLCIGRLDANKNQSFLIRMMPELLKQDGSYKLLLVGNDEMNGKCQKLARKLGVEKNVLFLGFRKDISRLLHISDVVVSASKREGLPQNLIEAATVGVPIVAIDCRGTRDIKYYCGDDKVSLVDCADMMVNKIRASMDHKGSEHMYKARCNVFQLNSVLNEISYIYGVSDSKGKITLSIGIPVYNAEKYLDDLLNRLTMITDSKVEIIIVDDGSNDNSLKICKKYRRSNMHIISQKNAGPSDARNRIIEMANGEWITFVDSDDLLIPQKYMEILRFLDTKYGWYINISDDGLYKKILKARRGDKKLSLLIENEVINSPCMKFYRRDILLREGIRFNSRYSIGEDLLFNLEYSKHMSKPFLFCGTIYIQRLNDNSLTHRVNKTKFEELIGVNDCCMDLWKENKKAKKALQFIRVKNCLSCLLDYKRGKAEYSFEKAVLIKRTKLVNYIILNTLKTTILFWAWKMIPLKLLLIII